MAYAALADMIAHCGMDELVAATRSRNEALDAINTDAVELAVEDASSFMDSYLVRRYVVPVSPVPRSLVHCCCKLARYALNGGDGCQPTDQMRADRKDAQAWLADIAKGTATLDGVVVSDSSSEWSRFAARAPGLSPTRCF